MAEVDARAGSTQSIIPCKAIDLHVLEKLETDMDDYDKVSCLFLIINDYKQGYKTFVDAEGNAPTMISNFIRESKVAAGWQDKILEAICIMQNNKIIENLGIPIEYTKTFFATRTAEISFNVNKYAKAFYYLFDNLTSNDESKLLEKVYEEITAPKIFFNSPASNSLEIHLLWWIQKGFIDISGDVWNLDKILRVLKTLDMTRSDGYDTLKKYQSQDSYHNDDRSNGDRPGTHSSQKTDRKTMPNETKNKNYEIRTGLGIVFNQMEFPRWTGYEYRHGSLEDCKRIKETFGKSFGFDLEFHENLKKEEIYSILNNLKNKVKNYDCLVVFILSHGTCGNIISSDGQECSIDDISEKVCTEALVNKPKVLVIQACQKKATLKTDGLPRQENNLDRFRDFVLLTSTIPGESAIRDPRQGTWYIQILCDVFVDMSKQGCRIEDCLLEINERFAKLDLAEINGYLYDQVPLSRQTLRKHLIFPYKAASSI